MKKAWKMELMIFTVIFLVIYYSWIHYFDGDNQTKTLVASSFSITAPFIAFILCFNTFKRLKGSSKYFWLFISIGCLSYTVAEALWIFYENFLQIEVPFPGLTDLFYMIQFVFYLSAFISQMKTYQKGIQLIKFIFDVCILMTVAITFSWHYLIKDLINQDYISFLYLFVSLGYPVGDLILLLCLIGLLMSTEIIFNLKVMLFILASLSIQIIADTAYFYETANNSYFSGTLYDPLWSLSLLLMGLGALHMSDINQNMTSGVHSPEDNTLQTRQVLSFRLTIPYLAVIGLFIFMTTQNNQVNVLVIGSIFSIILVMIRQFFTLIENQKLLVQYHLLNENLESKISERTAELSVKNEQLIKVLQKMKHLAFHDTLSGLPNRRLFREKLSIALREANRLNQQIAVIFIDLDRFKNINDTLGHESGDLLLKQVAHLMNKHVRPDDTISRQGGDEFALLFNNVSSQSKVVTLIQEIQSEFRQPIMIGRHEINVSMSIGTAIYPQDGNSVEELLKHADMAMYHAKENGKNRYQFFTSDMHQVMSRKMLLETNMRKAINHQEFVLHYMPQMNLKTGRIIGMEALIRWQTPEGEFISPGEFIPLAEENRMIIPIGEWVLYSACKQAKAWHDAGYKDLKLAVNLSPLQFLDDNLVNMIRDVLLKTGFNPAFLEMEITEGVAIYDTELSIKKMKEIRDLNVRIVIDDFGTGYSSLIYLKEFPIQSLKIPQEFITRVTDDTKDKDLVGAMISMAHSLRLSVIAEGVETKEQLRYLRDLRCDDIQGYVYSKPLSAEAFEAFLKKSSYYLPAAETAAFRDPDW